jgi:hypothetical protein
MEIYIVGGMVMVHNEDEDDYDDAKDVKLTNVLK